MILCSYAIILLNSNYKNNDNDNNDNIYIDDDINNNNKNIQYNIFQINFIQSLIYLFIGSILYQCIEHKHK